MAKPTGKFEFFVASRYLRAKRKQAVISLVTAISVAGVAAGVMALVVALAINAGFRNTLQRNLLGATAHVSLMEREPGYGIADWRPLASKLAQLPNVGAASGSLYGKMFLSGPRQSGEAVLKGIEVASDSATLDLVRNLREGSIEGLKPGRDEHMGLLVGTALAASLGVRLDDTVNVTNPYGEITAFGPRPTSFLFRVAGIFETGFFDIDNGWVVTSLANAQRVMGVPDVTNAIELKLNDIYLAPGVATAAEQAAGEKFAATTWMEQNRQILNALRMERVVTVITIGLIVLVAALNILISLVMMVMEKQRDIAILVSMGARPRQIRRIFQFQGVLIGLTGAVFGLIIGYTLCYFANQYQWIRLDQEVYALSYVPFEPRWLDGIWVTLMAVIISFVATLYPAHSAARIVPVESLRYE